MTDRPTVLLALDGNSLAHRAYHAYQKSQMTTADGRPVWAVYGFFALLAGICDKVSPDALIVGFDDHTSSVRKDAYPDYKANRERKDDALYEQMDAIVALLRRIGVATVIADGWEADDVVASAATQAADRGWQTIVATSDKDAFALIDENTRVLRLVSGLDNAELYDDDMLQDTYGIRAGQYTDFAALRGDSSDNLPGVRGIGVKTAAKLLAVVPTVADAYDDLDRIRDQVGAAAANRLLAGRDAWERNVELMTQRRDLDVDLDHAPLDRIDESDVIDGLRDAELPNLVARVAAQLAGTTTARTTRRSSDVVAPPPAAPPPPPSAAARSRPAGRPARRRGLPERSDSTPTVTVPPDAVVRTTGGAARPDVWPRTLY